MITVIRAADGSGAQRGIDTFTGEVWKDGFIRQDGVGVATVHFAPCARTHWHTHEGGQLLIIIAGEGVIGDESGEVLVSAGEMAWTPGGTPHWHGAADNRNMVHTAISIGTADWRDPVSDETYFTALKAVRP